MGRRNIPDRLPQDGTSKGNYTAIGLGNEKGSIHRREIENPEKNTQT